MGRHNRRRTSSATTDETGGGESPRPRVESNDSWGESTQASSIKGKKKAKAKAKNRAESEETFESSRHSEKSVGDENYEDVSCSKLRGH